MDSICINLIQPDRPMQQTHLSSPKELIVMYNIINILIIAIEC